jgi:hypothetical protein
VGTARVGNRVTVRGNVASPGPIGLRPGLLLSDALRAAGGPQPDTYLGRVLVTRLERDSSRVQLRAVLRDLSGAVINDFPLREDDEIEVFSVPRSAPTGRCRSAARCARAALPVPLRHVPARPRAARGGVTEGALLTEAEIAGLPAVRGRGRHGEHHPRSRSTRPTSSTRGGPRVRARAGVPTAAPARRRAGSSLRQRALLRQPDFELQRTVFVGGEVRYPGGTPAAQDERLTTVIARAGGLTSRGVRPTG